MAKTNGKKGLTSDDFATAILRHSPIGNEPEAKLIAAIISQAAQECIESQFDSEPRDFALDGRMESFSNAIGVPFEYTKSCFWAFVIHKLEIMADSYANNAIDLESGLTFENMKKENRRLKSFCGAI